MRFPKDGAVRDRDPGRPVPRPRGLRLSHRGGRVAVRHEHLPAGRQGRRQDQRRAPGLEPAGDRSGAGFHEAGHPFAVRPQAAWRALRAAAGLADRRGVVVQHRNRCPARNRSPTACRLRWTRCRNAWSRSPTTRPRSAQQVTLPIIVNGRIDPPGDWDVFRFQGRAGDQIVAEVQARRLDSPLDSVLRLTDADRPATGLQRRSRGQGRGPGHAPRRFVAPRRPACRRERTICTWATSSTRAARSMPTACASARRSPISRCGSCRRASTSAAARPFR